VLWERLVSSLQNCKNPRSHNAIYSTTGRGAIANVKNVHRSGFTVITTCSPTNFEYVKSLGADVTFNSRDPEAGVKIREYTKNELYYAWDCIGDHGSSSQCANALASKAPEGQQIRYGTILYGECPPAREDLTFTESIAYSAGGYAFKVVFNGEDLNFPAQPAHLEWMVKWVQVAEKLLLEEKWKPQRPEVREGGLDRVLDGLEDLKAGKVSGVKLTYRVAKP
jgi:NADPH:quinone reductase-like Zn-dependent oxidoreductase